MRKETKEVDLLFLEFSRCEVRLGGDDEIGTFEVENCADVFRVSLYRVLPTD